MGELRGNMGASADADPALVASDQAASRLAPSGFDPLRIEIPGVPVAKGRPKLSTRGGFARAYTPAKTRRYEDLVRLAAAEAMADRELFEGPLNIIVAVDVPIPQSLQTKPKLALIEQRKLMPTTRPDLDNYIKCIDGLNGIVWKDDAQIVWLSAVKHYSLRPCLAITVIAA